MFAAVLCAGAWCSNASADENAAPARASRERSVVASAEYPACTASLRLSAVSYDSKSAERSFALFGGGREQRPKLIRRGGRIGGYEVASIEQGAVVLETAAQRCSVRLRGTNTAREGEVVPVATVRRAMQARKAAVQAAAVRTTHLENLQARAD